MHVTELTEGLINKLREYVEITPDGHILTKKINPRATRAKVGKIRGSKSKQGMKFSFVFPETSELLTCDARDIVWIFNSGLYDLKMKVQPKNGDIFDDRLENLELVKRSNNGRPPKSKDSSQSLS